MPAAGRGAGGAGVDAAGRRRGGRAAPQWADAALAGWRGGVQVAWWRGAGGAALRRGGEEVE